MVHLHNAVYKINDSMGFNNSKKFFCTGGGVKTPSPPPPPPPAPVPTPQDETPTQTAEKKRERLKALRFGAMGSIRTSGQGVTGQKPDLTSPEAGGRRTLGS